MRKRTFTTVSDVQNLSSYRYSTAKEETQALFICPTTTQRDRYSPSPSSSPLCGETQPKKSKLHDDTKSQLSPTCVACLSASSSQSSGTALSVSGSDASTHYWQIINGETQVMESPLKTPVDQPTSRYAINDCTHTNLECDETIDDASILQAQLNLTAAMNASSNSQLEKLRKRLQCESAEFDQFLQTQWNTETVYQPFMQYFVYQTGITEAMRVTVFDWMYEVGADFTMQTDTVYRACNIVDRYLSLCPPSFEEQRAQHAGESTASCHYDSGVVEEISAPCMLNSTNHSHTSLPAVTPSQFNNIGQGNFQLLGITALYIIAKFDEMHAPTLDELCSTTDGACTVQEMICMEREILKVIDWKLVAPTISTWMLSFLRLTALACTSHLARATEDTEESSTTIYDRVCSNDVLAMLSSSLFAHALNCVHIFARDARSLQYYPSTIATSMLCILYPPGSPLHEPVLQSTSYTYAEMHHCIVLLQCIWDQLQPIVESQSETVFESSSCGICTYHPQSLTIHSACLSAYENMERAQGFRACHRLLDATTPAFFNNEDIAVIKQTFEHSSIQRPLADRCDVPLI